MTRMRERVFAGLGAVLFFFCAIAATILTVRSASSSNTDATSQQTAQACTDNRTEPAEAVPDIYKPGAAVTELQKTDLAAGSGPAAKDGDCLVVKYYGTLASNGMKFDENFTTTEGFAFTLGQGQVIQGWDQGLVGMKAGGIRRLVIPASLGYGDQASGDIPANSDLVFVVKLLRIQ